VFEKYPGQQLRCLLCLSRRMEIAGRLTSPGGTLFLSSWCKRAASGLIKNLPVRHGGNEQTSGPRGRGTKPQITSHDRPSGSQVGRGKDQRCNINRDLKKYNYTSALLFFILKTVLFRNCRIFLIESHNYCTISQFHYNTEYKNKISFSSYSLNLSYP
jgi:hypothetical protein